MLGMAAGAVSIMLYQWIMGRKRVVETAKDVLTEMIDDISLLIANRLGETEEDTEAFYNFVKDKYPDIVIVGRDSLQEAHADQIDRVINEINSFSPQVVLTCSRNMEIERFVACLLYTSRCV